MFSFVSRAKPGKHYLIETDDEDGHLENGSVLQHGSVAKKNDKNGAVAVANPGSAMRVEKCKIGKEWKEHNGNENGKRKLISQYLKSYNIFQLNRRK